MSKSSAGSRLQKVIETVESLDPQDQAVLVEIVSKRLIQARRTELISEVSESRAAYALGDVRRGSLADLMAEAAE